MNILRLNTSPSFEFIPRENITSTSFSIELKNENNQNKQTVSCSVVKLENENYKVTLSSFPTGINGDKFSYSILTIRQKLVVAQGKLLIIGQNDSVQDYSKKSTNKFYK
jgi:hypothetical protein